MPPHLLSMIEVISNQKEDGSLMKDCNSYLSDPIHNIKVNRFKTTFFIIFNHIALCIIFIFHIKKSKFNLLAAFIFFAETAKEL